jgi:hypothetical protein
MTEDRVRYLDREFLYFEETGTWDEVEEGTDVLVEVSDKHERVWDQITAAPDAPPLVYRLVLDEGTGRYAGVEIARRFPE